MSATLPDSDVPGLASVAADGAPLSMRTEVIAVVVEKPALSVMIARLGMSFTPGFSRELVGQAVPADQWWAEQSAKVTVAAFQGRGYEAFVAHDLDDENVALLRERKISAVLHHDLRVDLRRACHAILQANGVLPGPVRTNPSAIQVITPHNAPPVEF